MQVETDRVFLARLPGRAKNTLETAQLHRPEKQRYRGHRSSQNKCDAGLKDADAPNLSPTPIVNHRLTPTRQHLLNCRGAILAPKMPLSSATRFYAQNTSIFKQDYEGGAGDGDRTRTAKAEGF